MKSYFSFGLNQSFLKGIFRKFDRSEWDLSEVILIRKIIIRSLMDNTVLMIITYVSNLVCTYLCI